MSGQNLAILNVIILNSLWIEFLLVVSYYIIFWKENIHYINYENSIIDKTYISNYRIINST